MMGKGHWLVDAGARAKVLGEVELSDIHIAVNRYSTPSCWKGPLLSAPRTCGSMAPSVPGHSATVERFALKTSDSSTAHQRNTALTKTVSSTRKSMAARLTNYTAGRTPSSEPGETKKTQTARADAGEGTGIVHPHSAERIA